MKKILAMALSVAIIATIAISGTVAYFTDQKSAVNTFTVGNVVIQLLEEQREIENGNPKTNGDLEPFEQNKNLMPAVGSAQADNKDKWGLDRSEDIKNYVDKIVRVKNTGKNDAWVRIYVAIPAALDNDDGTSATNVLHWNYGNKFKDVSVNDDATNTFEAEFGGWKSDNSNPNFKMLEDKATINGVVCNVYCYTRKTVLKPGETTAAAFVGFYLDKNVDYIDETNTYIIRKDDGTYDVIDYDLGKGVTIPVFAQAVQVEGFEDSAETAFETAFTTKPWATTDDIKPMAEPSAGTTVTINSAKELRSFAKAVNSGSSFSGVTVELGNDIDLKNEEWTPIGQDPSISGVKFAGTFDGKGHTIKNLSIMNPSTKTNYANGLFGYTKEGSTIKNLTIDGATVNGYHQAGAVVGNSYGTVTDCTVKNAHVYSTHRDDANCGDKAGAVIGFAQSGTISNCKAEDCTVSAAREAGQLIGCAAAGENVTNCSAKNVVVTANASGCDHDNAGKLIGGLIGHDLGANITSTTT